MSLRKHAKEAPWWKREDFSIQSLQSSKFCHYFSAFSRTSEEDKNLKASQRLSPILQKFWEGSNKGKRKMLTSTFTVFTSEAWRWLSELKHKVLPYSSISLIFQELVKLSEEDKGLIKSSGVEPAYEKKKDLITTLKRDEPVIFINLWKRGKELLRRFENSFKIFMEIRWITLTLTETSVTRLTLKK